MFDPSPIPEPAAPQDSGPAPDLEAGGNLRATPPGTSWPLPTDLADSASKRLGIASLIWACIWGLGILLNSVVGPILSPDRPLDDAWPWPGTPVALVVIAVSLGLFFYTRRANCNCRFALDLGLVYEVALAFAIGIVNQWTPNTLGLSWICVLILIHPVIVPHKPRWILLAALASASMDPVGLLITKARGVPMPPFLEFLWYVLPNYICALLAVLPSHIVSRMGREVSRARELGSYRLGDLLGKGGMGEVYSARHVMLRRPAAIKLIRPEALSASGRGSQLVVRRFRREAEVVANLHSPHTIILYDFGTTRSGDFYYVMELLHGMDLETLVRRFGPVPPARVVHLLRQACHSLAEAHAHSLVHRDVKPSNLFTCKVGLETDFVKVLDFGLVKGHLEEGRSQVTLTAPDLTTGTPAYMAPELAGGEEADGRADIYALGCVAFWLLTGRLVFEEKTPTRMILAHLRDRPEPPSLFSEFEIEKRLDDLILACLEKAPRNRPGSAEELARRLAACSVDAPWTADSAQAWWTEHAPELLRTPSPD